MKQKAIKNIFSLMLKLDISFAICVALVIVFYMVSYSAEQIIDDIFWIMLVLAMLTTYYFLRQDVVLPLVQLGDNAKKINAGNYQKLENIVTDTPEFLAITISYNHILSNIERATTFIQQIESGDLEASLEIKENEALDTLSQALLKMRNTMRQIDTEEYQRSWTAQGVAMLSEILRTNNQDVKGLSKHIMISLVPYLNAIQGAIFIVEDKQKEENEQDYVLQMTGMYAYGRQKYIRKSVLVGAKYTDSLIGQAFLERQILTLKEIPEGYLEVSSGLGDAPPQNLILAPLLVDGNSYGVLEIASFQVFEAYQIAFVERVSESIALTIATVRINQQTKELLEESQRQAEQLKSQEEEMRQNLEELATTQEEMNRKNNELEAANNKANASAQILEKSLKKANKMQQEVQEKNVQMLAQEEEMRQNLEELVATQEELERQKTEIEASNIVLENAYKQAREDQQEIEKQEKMLRQTLEDLQNAQKEMLLHQTDLEEKTKKLQNNETILKKFMDRANNSDAKYKAIMREQELIITELQDKINEYEQAK